MERDVITKLIPPIAQLPKPALVGISGFGGAGKSTAAREIKAHISCAVLGVEETLTITDSAILVVEGVGLFRPGRAGPT